MSDQGLFEQAVQFHGQGDLARARRLYEELISKGLRIADSSANLSVIFLVQQNLAEAERYARLALQHDPADANAWNNLGLSLKHQNRWAEARDAYIKAVQSAPDHSRAWSNLAEAFDKTGDAEKGLAAATRSVQADPDWAAAQVQYIYRKLGAASWGGLDESIQKVSKLLRAGSTEIDPFLLLFICNDPAEIRLAARAKSRLITQAAEREAVASMVRARKALDPDGKIRIGYVSSNFSTHAVAAHILEVLESHDRDKFEVYCYCHTLVPSEHVQERMEKSGARFKRIHDMSSIAAANLIREDGIDVLIDLMGYTEGARLGIFAHRPAPVAITWIGFAGSLGAPWMDYILADEVVIPTEHEQFYDEKIIRLGCSYQSNDSARLIHPVPPKRSDYGLPENVPLLCCFNKPAKINPGVVALWVQIMMQVPDAVLWLWGLTDMASRNLKGVFSGNKINPDRIIMARSEPFPIHLARHALCDLFLDTFPYTGHATASNALYGGCPVLTLQGPTFAARVSASLLKDLEMEELIADTPQDYVQKAVDLLKSPEKVKGYKQRLDRLRTESPLFDGKLFARRFDKALEQIVARNRAGEEPDHITL